MISSKDLKIYYASFWINHYSLWCLANKLSFFLILKSLVNYSSPEGFSHDKICNFQKWAQVHLCLEDCGSVRLWLLEGWSQGIVIRVWLMLDRAPQWGAVIWMGYRQRGYWHYWGRYWFCNTGEYCGGLRCTVKWKAWAVFRKLPRVTLFIAHCWRLDVPCWYRFLL
jgi:hypothetical protein